MGRGMGEVHVNTRSNEDDKTKAGKSKLIGGEAGEVVLSCKRL